MKNALAVLLFIGASGCTATWEQGEFGALSTRATPAATSVVQRTAEGRSCFAEELRLAPRARDAIEKALAQAPTAEALANVRMTNQGFCVRASGAAVRLTPPDAPVE